MHGYLDDIGVAYCGRYGDWLYIWTDEAFISGENAAQKALDRMGASKERVTKNSEISKKGPLFIMKLSRKPSRSLPVLQVEVHHTFVDLGMSPLCESYLRPEQINQTGVVLSFARLRVRQMLSGAVGGVRQPRIRSSPSTLIFLLTRRSWLEHSPALHRADDRAFSSEWQEPGSGTCQQRWLSVQYFVEKMPVLGIEPAANVAKVAVGKRSVPTLVKFFGDETGRGIGP